jgi:intron-binding protein aquarius
VETWNELAQGCKARERNPAHGPGNRVQDPKIWYSQLRYALSQLTPIDTTITMAPRTRNKEDARREPVDDRPTVADLEGESSFSNLARKLWLNKKTAKVKVKPDVLKTEIWDLLEKEDFSFKSLLVLENLQILERYELHVDPFHSTHKKTSYLWPGYSEDSSNFHVLLIVLISNVKTREHLSTWGR